MEINYLFYFMLAPVEGMIAQWPFFRLNTFRTRVRPVLTLDGLSVFSSENNRSDWLRGLKLEEHTQSDYVRMTSDA